MGENSRRSLKIGLVLDDGLDKPDGVQQYVISIGEWLTSCGHDVHYLVGQTSRQDMQGVHSLARNVRVRFSGNRLTMPLPTSRRKLQVFLNEQQFDVLHVQMPYSPFMGQRLIAAASKEVAVVGTFHILPYNRLSSIGNRGLKVWLRASLARFDQVVSVSSAAADFAKKTYSLDSLVLPNVINYKRFHDARPLKKYDDERLTILFLGRLVSRKGCLLLLQAVQKLTKNSRLPDFKVLICGRGPLESDLKQFVKRHNLQSLVEFTGFISEADKPSLYASADIAVFPSRGGESFGIVLIEAMANGRTAVLAGDNPGYRSVMEHQPDLLFDPTNSAALARKLEYLMLNPEICKHMSHWGEIYSKSFDVGIVGSELLDIYHKALRKRGSL